VRAWRADRRRRGEPAHTGWHAGSPAETQPGGVCGADAYRAHAQTSRSGHGMATHGGGATAMRGRACARATSRRHVPGPDALHVPLFGRAKHKIFNLNPSNYR
jgi:hypothetical protein